MKLQPVSTPLLLSLRIMALALAALALFGLTALLCALLISQLSAASGLVTLGIVCGLIVWLFVAVFHLKREKVALPFTERDAFLRKLTAELGELGYKWSTETDGGWIYRPDFLAFVFGGSVRVDVAVVCVQLTGPRVCVENVRNRLRLHNHTQGSRSTRIPLRNPSVRPEVPAHEMAKAE